MYIPIINVDQDCIKFIGNQYQKAFYIPKIDKYFFSEYILWITDYERYYNISEEDYELFKKDINAFNIKFSKEHMQRQDCFTKNFVGSPALKDYDGMTNFHQFFPSPEVNPFQHHAFIDGVFYAIIIWKDNTILVPPVQAIDEYNGIWTYPLRKFCDLQMGPDDVTPICYKRKGKWKRIECPCCHRRWMFDTSEIPIGEKYEIICPHCTTKIWRKEIN